MTAQTGQPGEVTIRLEAKGAGRHSFALRASNLRLEKAAQEAVLPAVLAWRAKRIERNEPWVVVAIPDGETADRKELSGFKP